MPTKETRKYRRIFESVYGPPPHPCHWCAEPVTEWGRGHGIIHHLDENRKNNDPANLVPGHDGCHARHHTGPEWRAKGTAAAAIANTGRPKSPEHRAKISAANKGTPPSELARRRSSETKKGVPLTAAHREAIRRSWIARRQAKGEPSAG